MADRRWKIFSGKMSIFIKKIPFKQRNPRKFENYLKWRLSELKGKTVDRKGGPKRPKKSNLSLEVGTLIPLESLIRTFCGLTD